MAILIPIATIGAAHPAEANLKAKIVDHGGHGCPATRLHHEDFRDELANPVYTFRDMC